jgi:hypothetical protein
MFRSAIGLKSALLKPILFSLPELIQAYFSVENVGYALVKKDARMISHLLFKGIS